MHDSKLEFVTDCNQVKYPELLYNYYQPSNIFYSKYYPFKHISFSPIKLSKKQRLEKKKTSTHSVLGS